MIIYQRCLGRSHAPDRECGSGIAGRNDWTRVGEQIGRSERLFCCGTGAPGNALMPRKIQAQATALRIAKHPVQHPLFLQRFNQEKVYSFQGISDASIDAKNPTISLRP